MIKNVTDTFKIGKNESYELYDGCEFPRIITEMTVGNNGFNDNDRINKLMKKPKNKTMKHNCN